MKRARFVSWLLVSPLMLGGWFLVDGCSTEDSAPGGGTGGSSPVPACGELTAEQARTTAVDRWVALENAVLDAWPAIENSRLLPRVLSLGNGGTFAKATDGRADVEALRADLDRYVFADANLESAQGADVVYQLKPAAYCKSILDDCAEAALPVPVAPAAGGMAGMAATGGMGGASGTCTSQGYLDDYAACVQDLTDHEMRVKVTRIACESGTNLRVSLLAGQERVIAATVELYQDRTIGRIDFGQMAQAIPLLADPTDDVAVIAGSSGQIQAELRVPGKGQAEFRVDVPQAVDFSWVADAETYGFSVAAGERVLELGLDAGARTAHAHFGLGLTGIETPLDDFVSGWFGGTVSDPAHQHDVARFELAGLTGEASYDGSSDVLHLSGLGLGTSSSRLAYGNLTLVGIDVDAPGDRKIDVDFSVSDSGEPMATLRPDFPLVINYAMQQVAAYCTGLPAFALDDTLTIRFFDPSAASARFLLDTNGDTALTGTEIGALLSILTGQLDITSRTTPAENVTLEAGQCLWRDADRPGTHVVLRTLYPAACP